MPRIITLLFVLLASVTAVAQTESPFQKFGKISAENLKTKVYTVDSNANAVVLSDIGEISLEGNRKGWFSLVTHRHRVVHILNKNGYDLANVEIPLVSGDGSDESVQNIKAVTYNLENGRIVETKLEKSAIFKEKVNKNRMIMKFTMPNVKEGSIIEFQYVVTSDYIRSVDPWFFQETEAPVLWSELLFNVPQFFSYSFIKRGHHRMHIDDISGSHSSFTIRANPEFGFSGYERSSDTRLDANITRYRWVMKDVPELKKESYTTTLYNHISRIEFQFAATNYPLVANNYRMTWGSLTNALLDHENFGRALQKDNGWSKDERNALLKGADSDLEKARRIYVFVRENFTCNDHDAVTVDQSLKNAMKSRKGSVADINLLLISMLRDAGLEADPVILSTTENGYVFELYPIPGAFNYVICQFRSGKQRYYLDASWSGLGFGQLRPFCYNGHARVVNNNIGAVDLSPDSLRESSMTSVFVSNLDNGTWAGTMKHTAGMNESFELRSRITDKGEEAYFTEKVKGFGNDIIVNKQSVTGLKDYDQPLVLEYDFKLKLDGDETIYLSPLFGENYKDNPFKSLVRHYPVEMPYTLDEIFVLTMEVPKGYVVDELPEQMLMKLDEQGKSFFEYRISHSGEIISLRSRIKIDRASYPADEYDYLREFFALLVSKQSEQIVLKKKK